ncbi:hypothetical protein B0H21DRAFT_707819 [Amylocystis lapponica]|nr:hypothetical protein B0H21DRAFT_707819 [Amylocystis lapponica]
MNTDDMRDEQPSSEDEPTASSSNEFSATMRAQHGVNVRDFAYESTLPPVLVVPHIPVQVQPGINSLKRGRKYYEEEGEGGDPPGQYTFYIDSDSVGSSHGTRRYQEPRPIERTPTEPADDNIRTNGHPLRSIGFATLFRPRGRDPAEAGPSTPSRAHLKIPGTSRSPPPPFDPENFPSQPSTSQDSEPWIDTPRVTPNGSLQWNLPVPGEDVTFSQLGFSPERSQPRATLLDPSPPRPSRPRRISLTPSSCANRSSSPLPEAPHVEDVEDTSGKSADEAPADAMAENQVPRYHLRDRPPAPPRPSARPNKRARGAQTVVAQEAAAVKRPSPVKSRKTGKAPPAAQPTRRSARIGRHEPGAIS